MKNRYQRALDIQDAINPQGVTFTLLEEMAAFRDSPSFTGTASLKNDAALRMIVYKLADMMGGTVHAEAYTRAEQACKRMAYGPSDRDISAAVRGTLGSGT